jgi:TolB-like protein/Tfp pilus assembly protein PilF
MADIFISYASESEPQAERVTAALRAGGFSVWRDDELPPHRAYAEVIEERLGDAKAVVVLWTRAASRSQWVRAEADLARCANKLVQIALDDVLPPLPFNQIQCARLGDWTGQDDHQEWRQVIASLKELVATEAGAAGRPSAGPAAGSQQDERRSGRGAKASGAPRLSIVVLPFANLSRDPDQEYFVDGMTESLTTDLSRIHGSFVIARNTAFTYKGRAVDAHEIGRTLNVRYVLEGSVQRAGERLRVSVQLIDVESGSHLWAERFDKSVADIFETQDEIVNRLARALDVQLVAAEARSAAGAASPDSMDLYFRGQAVVNLGFGPEEAIESRRLFDEALRLDPDNVAALAALSQYAALAVALAFFQDDGAETLAMAEKAAIRAVELSPNHAKSHLALAQVYSFTNRIPQALAEYRRALSLDRNYTQAYAGFAAANMYDGKSTESEAHIAKAFQLSPQDSQAHLWCLIAGTAKLLIEDYAAAEAWFRRGIEINRSYPIQVLYLAGALQGLGRTDEARAMIQEALRLNPRFSQALVRSIRRSTNPVYIEQLAKLLTLLGEAGLPAA